MYIVSTGSVRLLCRLLVGLLVVCGGKLAHTWLTATRDFDGLNSGVVLLKRTRQARDLLDFAWRQTSFNNSFSAEQNALPWPAPPVLGTQPLADRDGDHP